MQDSGTSAVCYCYRLYSVGVDVVGIPPHFTWDKLFKPPSDKANRETGKILLSTATISNVGMWSNIKLREEWNMEKVNVKYVQ